MISVINVFELYNNSLTQSASTSSSGSGASSTITPPIGQNIPPKKTPAQRAIEQKNLTTQKQDIDNQQKVLADRERQILVTKAKV